MNQRLFIWIYFSFIFFPAHSCQVMLPNCDWRPTWRRWRRSEEPALLSSRRVSPVVWRRGHSSRLFGLINCRGAFAWLKHLSVSMATWSHLATPLNAVVAIHFAQGLTVDDIVTRWKRRHHSGTRTCMRVCVWGVPFFFQLTCFTLTLKNPSSFAAAVSLKLFESLTDWLTDWRTVDVNLSLFKIPFYHRGINIFYLPFSSWWASSSLPDWLDKWLICFFPIREKSRMKLRADSHFLQITLPTLNTPQKLWYPLVLCFAVFLVPPPS